MARKKKEPNRVDDLLDELLEDCRERSDLCVNSGSKFLATCQKSLVGWASCPFGGGTGETHISQDHEHSHSRPLSNRVLSTA